MIRGDSIIIKKFNNIMDFELPSNNINIIAGNDYDFQNNIIMALNMYFGTLKESNDDIEYNGDNLKLYD